MQAQSSILPKEAHKESAANLWVQKFINEAGGSASITFSLPNTLSSFHFTLLMEAQRQAGIVFAHRNLAVPQSHAFILASMSLEASSNISLDKESLKSGVIEVRADAVRTVNGATRQAEVLSQMTAVHGVPAYKGRMSSRFVEQAVYDRVRASIKSTPATTDACSVCLNRQETAVAIDTSNPLLRDHETDHVAAIDIIAAIESAVQARHSRELTALSIKFRNYMELTPIPSIWINLDNFGAMVGCIHQGEAVQAHFQGQTKVRDTSHDITA